MTYRTKNTRVVFFKLYAFIHLIFFLFGNFWPSRLGLQNTPTASPQRGKTPPTNVLDMTRNNLIVRLQ